MTFYSGKSVLVTGGTGLVGQPLVELLLQAGAKIRVASLDLPARAPSEIDFRRADLREFAECMRICEGQEIVFQVAGIKGSPKMAAERPASFFVPTLQLSLNTMEAARRCGVEHYLFTSSVGVYAPAEVLKEDDVWKTAPSPNDRFAGWAKRMGELQAEAYKIEYGWDRISIVRPANVYGPHDNFDPENAMVVPSLIHRALNSVGPLTVWGDGSPIRDFIHAHDVARGMMMIVEKGVSEPVNLGSGSGIAIRRVVEIIVSNLPQRREITWDPTRPSGDQRRLMDTTRAGCYGFRPEISIEDGIRETMEWYQRSRRNNENRYNPFTEQALRPVRLV